MGPAQAFDPDRRLGAAAVAQLADKLTAKAQNPGGATIEYQHAQGGVWSTNPCFLGDDLDHIELDATRARDLQLHTQSLLNRHAAAQRDANTPNRALLSQPKGTRGRTRNSESCKETQRHTDKYRDVKPARDHRVGQQQQDKRDPKDADRGRNTVARKRKSELCARTSEQLSLPPDIETFGLGLDQRHGPSIARERLLP